MVTSTGLAAAISSHRPFILGQMKPWPHSTPAQAIFKRQQPWGPESDSIFGIKKLAGSRMLISKGEDITDNSWNISGTQQSNTSQGNICLSPWQIEAAAARLGYMSLLTASC
jgi:hypothetical protein